MEDEFVAIFHTNLACFCVNLFYGVNDVCCAFIVHYKFVSEANVVTYWLELGRGKRLKSNLSPVNGLFDVDVGEKHTRTLTLPLLINALLINFHVDLQR